MTFTPIQSGSDIWKVTPPTDKPDPEGPGVDDPALEAVKVLAYAETLKARTQS